jgi:hypothetical protein
MTREDWLNKNSEELSAGRYGYTKIFAIEAASIGISLKGVLIQGDLKRLVKHIGHERKLKI